jgi:hypothetical protein
MGWGKGDACIVTLHDTLHIVCAIYTWEAKLSQSPSQSAPPAQKGSSEVQQGGHSMLGIVREAPDYRKRLRRGSEYQGKG